jgi:hypothetical protein
MLVLYFLIQFLKYFDILIFKQSCKRHPRLKEINFIVRDSTGKTGLIVLLGTALAKKQG